jgi:hypothetical protein
LSCNSAFIWLMIKQRFGWLPLEDQPAPKR